MADEKKNLKELKNTYFAASDSEEAAHILLDKAESFFNTMRANSYLEKLNQMWLAYHGAYNKDVGSGHQITFTGEQGELVQLPVNHFRNLARHIYNLITANRPTMDARAVNSDFKSLSQTHLANGILDYYMREKGLEECITRALEMSIVLGAGFVKMDWNATGGRTYDADPETGEFDKEGELEFTNLTPLDVIVDGTKEYWDNEWIMVRSFENRYNLIAKYPEHAEKIMGMMPKSEATNYRLSIFSNDKTDDIPIYEFYHRKTEALPDGRYMLFLEGNLVLLDMPLPYEEIPIYRVSPSDILGTPYGYSDMFDVLPIQEAMNSLYSAVMTNQNAFSVQNVFIPRGADINYTTLEGGLNVIEGNAKPEPINLTETPTEVFKFLGDLVAAGETISGVSSVTRGNPEASLRSGVSLALVQSMSLQFQSGLQRNYIKFVESLGTAVIRILKDFADTPKLVALVGVNNRSYLEEFTGDMISEIDRVIVDVGNPLSKTIAGRVEMIEHMSGMGLIKNPQQYFQVLNTGRLDMAYQDEVGQIMLIQRENEDILNGKQVMTSLLDQHRMHIMEHRAVINDPQLRENPKLLTNLQNHVQEHINILRTADPDLLQLIGEQPLNPPVSQGDPNLPQGPLGGDVGSADQGGGISDVAGSPLDTDGLNKLPDQPEVDANLLPNPELEPRSK